MRWNQHPLWYNARCREIVDVYCNQIWQLKLLQWTKAEGGRFHCSVTLALERNMSVASCKDVSATTVWWMRIDLESAWVKKKSRVCKGQFRHRVDLNVGRVLVEFVAQSWGTRGISTLTSINSWICAAHRWLWSAGHPVERWWAEPIASRAWSILQHHIMSYNVTSCHIMSCHIVSHRFCWSFRLPRLVVSSTAS
jgi:hypothetical protein